MIIRMQNVIIAFLMARHFKGNIGNHLIGIHIDGGSGTALIRIEWKCRLPRFRMLNQFITSFLNGSTGLLGQFLKMQIGLCRSFFHLSQSTNKMRLLPYRQSGNLKIFDGT